MPGNERLDSLAQEAAITAVLRSPVPRTNVVPTISEAIIAIWQETWNVRDNTGKMDEFNITVSHPWNHTNVQDLRSQTALACLRIGHSRLTHIYLMSGDDQPCTANDCLVPFIVRHMLFECPSVAELHQRFVYKCQGADGVYSLCKVLEPACSFPGHDVLAFLKEAGPLSLL